MRTVGGGRAVGVALAIVAVLLPAGAWAAIRQAQPPSPTPIAAGGPVAVVSAAVDGVPVEPATTTTTAVAPTTSTRPSMVPTSARRTTTTVRRPATTTTTRADQPPATGPTTTRPPVPVQTRWSATEGRLAVAVRMEPPAPVAGRTVTFTVSVGPGVACCLGSTLRFGDEGDTQTSPEYHYVPASQACASATPRSAAKEHTYAEPGAYAAEVIVIGLECLPVPDENGVATGRMVRVVIPMCVGVGPGPEAAACAR